MQYVFHGLLLVSELLARKSISGVQTTVSALYLDISYKTRNEKHRVVIYKRTLNWRVYSVFVLSAIEIGASKCYKVGLKRRWLRQKDFSRFCSSRAPWRLAASRSLNTVAGRHTNIVLALRGTLG